MALRGQIRRPVRASGKRAFDIVVAAVFLLLLSPVLAACALAVRLDSPGPVFYRCRRVGFKGRPLDMIKFRKMHHDAIGLALTLGDDDRFTRVGKILARLKLDELPQLWHVLRGEMSLVGPRPEDPRFVLLHVEPYGDIVAVRPGITGLSQLAFARESSILDPGNPVGHYTERLLPQKVGLDRLYSARRTLAMDFKILFWTIVAVCLRADVAVSRETGSLRLRKRPAHAFQPNVVRPPIEHSEAPALSLPSSALDTA